MHNHLKAKPMGRLLDVLCQVGVTTILANFMLLDVPVDRDVPIIVGRSFLYACGEIVSTMKGKMSTFNGFVHQQYDVVNVRSNHEESNSDDDEEYYIKRDEIRKPFYGTNRAKYLNCDEPMDRALPLQDVINPFRKVCVSKKAISFIGALPGPLKNTKWAPNHSGVNTKENEDGKWNVKIRVTDPYDNVFEQGYETKETERKASELYKLSDIKSPNWL
ncbi:hypothetical protein Tco_0157726 [Tanacetum coccineum]